MSPPPSASPGAHNVRLVVKSGGHSYLGTSNAPDSLLIWTRPMNAITVHDAFTPQGSGGAPVPAVSAGAGCIWLHAYQAVTGGAGRYVQGGGCTTVGIPGLVLGGGFGSFSKAYGTVAASLLEAEIVTADGQIRIVNQAREPDLFWALKGGGGGTFGVVTRVTLATHELPDDLWRRDTSISRRFPTRPIGGSSPASSTSMRPTSAIRTGASRRSSGPTTGCKFEMMFQGLTQDEARAAWKPLIDFANATRRLSRARTP